jgi:hypothetical protein
MGLSCDDVLGQSLEVVGEINVYAILIMAPPALFLFFLLAKLRSAIKILRETAGVRLFRSAALAFIWVICFVNIGRVAVQVLIPTSFPIWKFMWLLLRSMFTFSQVAVAAFIFVLILHDVSFEQFISSLRLDSVTKRILLQTLISSTLVSCFELIVQVVLMFAMDEPIYSTTDSAEIAAVFWIIRGVLLLTVYFGLLVLLHVYPPIKDYTICETNCATALILSVVLFRCSGLQADLLSVCKKTRGGTAVQKYSTSIAGSLLF